MPDMNGRELADQVVKVRPDMRVLYVSGYSDDTVARQGVVENGILLLQKPFKPMALAKKVRDLLDARP
jgi:two-component SAPR family response regulator